MFTRDGREIWVRDVGHIRTREGGRQPIVEGLLMDITERKQAQDALRGSEAFHHQILDTMMEGCQIIGFDWRYLYVNEVITAQQARLKAEGMLNHTVMELYPGVENTELFTVLRRCMEERVPAQIETQFIFPDGRIGWFELSIQPTREGIFILSTDISERKQAGDKLRESEERYRTLVDEMLDGVYRSTHDGKFVEVNPAMLKLFGYDSREEMLALDIKQDLYFTAAERESLFLDTGQEKVDEFRMKRKDGSEIWVEDHGKYVHDEQGNVIYHEGILRDITERKRTEDALRNNELYMRKTLDSSLDAFVTMDDQGVIRGWNPQSEKIFGWSAAQAFGLLMAETIIPPVHRQAHTHGLKHFLNTGEGPVLNKLIEITALHRDGHEFPIELSITPIEQDGRFTFSAFIRDITERKQAERELVRERDFARQVMNTMGQGLTITGSDGRFEYVNQAYARMIGLRQEELIGKTPLEVTAEEDHPTLAHAGARRKRGESSTYETKLLHTSGRQIDALITGVPRLEDGQVIGSITVITDLTERKRAEEQLRETQDFMSTILELTPASIYTLSLDQRFTLVNQQWEQDTHIKRADAIGHSLDEIFPPALARKYQEDNLRVAETGSLLEVEEWAETPNGLRCYYTLKFPLRNADGLVETIGGLSLDITERKQAEKALLQFRSVLDQSRDAIFMIDPHTSRYVDFNQQAHSFLGYTAEELRGLNVIQIVQHIPNMDVWQERVRLIRQDNGLTFETAYMRKDGTTFPVEVSARMLEYSGQEIILAIVRDITERKNAEAQIREHIQHLTSLHTVDSVINASFDLGIVINVLLEQIVNQVQVDAADILLLNPDSLVLSYYTGRGFRSFVTKTDEIHLGENLAGKIALERKAMYVSITDDIDLKQDFAALWQREGFQMYTGIPLIAKGQVKGVLETYHRLPAGLDASGKEFLETLAGQAAIAIDNAQLFEQLQRSNLDLSMAYDATIEGWSRAMDLRDHATEGHTQRVTNLTLDLARFMNIPGSDLIHMYRGALLHDIGKMSMPDSILFKPAPLSPEELVIMRQHPLHAFNMLAPIHYLRPALDIPHCHHEKWDGTGYPRGLYGVEIPLAARIFAVADVWDALCSDRPYRVGWTQQDAEKYILEQSGKYFDPAVVDAFIKMLAARHAGNINKR